MNTNSEETKSNTEEQKSFPIVTIDSKEEETKTVETTEVEEDSNDEDDDTIYVDLKHLDYDFTCDLMSVPTVSSEEYRMVTFIILWAREHGIKYEFDTYGNVYLTKGELSDGEFYPCVTSHLDTVQTKQKAYAQFGVPLDLMIRTVQNKTTKVEEHELFVEGMGIGADCKTGVLISLSLFEHFDKIKAAFFLEEEIGMKGSDKMNVEWFNNVGYVIGWDSPELNRAAYSCSGTLLMTKDFYVNQIESVCKEHGLTVFNAEPFTDVKNIREKTDIICMNFGNGGYLAHSSSEYMTLEHTDKALGMGIDLIKKLGNNKYSMPIAKSSSWVKNENGTYTKDNQEDEKFFRSMNGYYSNYYDDYDDYYPYGNYGSTSKKSYSSETNKTTIPLYSSESKKDEKTVNLNTLKYISEKYEEHIEEIKKSIESKCNELGIDFENFVGAFSNEIKF